MKFNFIIHIYKLLLSTGSWHVIVEMNSQKYHTTQSRERYSNYVACVSIVQRAVSKKFVRIRSKIVRKRDILRKGKNHEIQNIYQFADA